jgi:hypothetical protein
MKTWAMVVVYIKQGGSAKNSRIYKEVAKILGVANDDDFRHCIRGLQQGLKRGGSLKRTGHGVWSYCK